MRFLCDEMLNELARWLRAAGYDTAKAEPSTPDRDLVQRAREEGRILLTRDKDILQIKNAADVTHVFASTDLDGWAAELRSTFKLDWQHDPMSRCLVCNVSLNEASDEDIALMPPDARALPGPYHTCPACKRIYWPGSHVRRMMARLNTFATGHDGSKGPSSAP